MTRPDPFTLVFGDTAAETFAAIREEFDRRDVNPADRDAFVLAGAVGAVLRRLVPRDAPPEALERHVAFLHHAYRYWSAGCPLFRVDASALLAATVGGSGAAVGPRCAYVQLPERRVWADVEAGAPAQPMDGFFLARTEGDLADLLAIFGLHAARAAFSVVPVVGPWDEATLQTAAVRADGSPIFSSHLPGGEAAGLLTVATGVEMLLFAHRLAAGLADHVAPT